MIDNTFKIVYLSSNILRIYSIYIFINILFKKKEIVKLTKYKYIELFLFGFYYGFNGFVFLKFNIPILTLITNIAMLFLISYLYKSSMKEKLLGILLIYLLLMMTETIIVLLANTLPLYVFRSNPHIFNSLIAVLSNLSVFFIVTIIGVIKYQKNDKGYPLPKEYWVSVMVIVISSLFITIAIASSSISSFKSAIIISIIMLMVFVSLHLLSELENFASTKAQKKILDQKNKYYSKQFYLMKSSVDNIMALKHDMSNHLFILSALIDKEENNKALEYLSSLEEKASFENLYIETGNTIIDSIFNYKVNELQNIGAEINLDVSIPHNLNIEALDAVIILGNIFDNSIEALKKIKSNKNFCISLKYYKGVLYLNCKNNFCGDISILNNIPVTSKNDSQKHGQGIRNIISTLEKYKGSIDFDFSDKVFDVTILMYI